MFSFVNLGSETLSNFIQLIAGCLISIPFRNVVIWWLKNTQEHKLSNKIIVFIATSFLGMLLPLNTFGVIPLIATLIINGAKLYYVLPLLVSNALFNTLTPFMEIGFRWHSEIGRVVFSLVIGIFSGILLWKSNVHIHSLIRKDTVDNFGIGSNRQLKLSSFLGKSILLAGAYIIAGVIINTFLYPHLLETFKTWFYGTPFGYETAKIISRANLFNIFFLAGLSIVDLLMNPVKLAAVFLIFRFKGLIVYYLYFLLWASVLALSLFVH